MIRLGSGDRLFSEIYKIDQATNLYMIEIALDRYTDVFNDWDPAPFKRRDIDPDLKSYLEGASEEIPMRYPLELCFITSNGIRESKLEEEVKNGLKNAFIFKLYLLRRELRKTNVQTLRCIILGFLFLWVGTVASRKYDQAGGVLSLLSEALFIGGWVFLWEAVSLFFFTNWEIFRLYRYYDRLKNAPIVFREAEG